MSLATLDRAPHATAPALQPAPAALPASGSLPAPASHPASGSLPAPAARPASGSLPEPVEGGQRVTSAPQPRRLRAVPDGTEARGFALYVGIDERKAHEAGIDLPRLVEELKRTIARLAPAAESYAAVALAPVDAGGRDVDVVRLALQDPAALAKHRQATESPKEDATSDRAQPAVIVDLSRKRVLLEGESASLTYKEFELLQYLVLREGRTVERAELIAGLWSAGDEETPSERTIDVHVRRLRSKLGYYEDIVRTVRGAGYRFDRHADVSVRFASTPSPDVI